MRIGECRAVLTRILAGPPWGVSRIRYACRMWARPQFVVVLFLLVAAPALRGGAQSAQATDAAPPPVALDALLKLPSDAPALEVDAQSGASRKEWEARFSKARADVESARAALAESQGELEELANETAAWQMAPPGASANAENSPVSFKLRQEIRQRREEVERAEKALTELRIEANLAGVPEEWQE